MKKRIALQRILMALAAVLVVCLGPVLLMPSVSYNWDEVRDAAGLIITLLGFSIRIASRGYKEEGSRSSQQLVTGGLYAYIRNPMYLGTLLVGLGLSVVALHPWAVLVFLIAYILIYTFQIRREEALLREKFGRDYEAYCQETPRFLPSWPNVRPFLGDLFPRRKKWVWREMSSVIVVILIILLLEMAMDSKVFGRESLFSEPVEVLATVGGFFIVLYILSKEEK